MEISIDSMSTCFLCLRKFSASSENVFSATVSLQNILNYLNISPVAIFQTQSIPGDTLLKDKTGESFPLFKLDKWDFSVKLCTDCQGVASELGKLVGQTELVKIHLDCQVQKLYKIIVGSPTCPLSCDALQEGREKLIITRLRAQVTKRCTNGKLETGSNCFVCCVGKSTDRVNDDGTLLTSFDLKNVFRHLKINPKKLPVRLDSFYATLCLACEVATGEMDFLVRQMDVLSMLRNYHLKTFYQILKASQLDNVRDHSKDVDWIHVELIRRKITEKSLSKWTEENNASVPIIRLQRLEPVSPQQDKSPDEKPLSMDIPSSTSGSEDIKDKLDYTKTTKTSNNLLTKKKVSVYSEHFKRLDNGSHVKCLICKLEIIKHGSTYHFVSTHPEKLFEPTMASAFTKEEFRQVIQHTLKNELDQARGSERRQPIICQYCHGKSHHGQHFRYHLITQHFTILEEKLNQAKSSSDLHSSDQFTSNGSHLDKTCQKYFHQNSTGSQHTICLICKIELPVFKTKIHLLTCHPQKLFESEKLESVTEERFIACCKQVLQNETYQSQIINRNNGTKQYEFDCRYCEKIYKAKLSFQQHLAGNHFKNLVETLISMQILEEASTNIYKNTRKGFAQEVELGSQIPLSPVFEDIETEMVGDSID